MKTRKTITRNESVLVNQLTNLKKSISSSLMMMCCKMRMCCTGSCCPVC
ncbi:MAG: hypothetical protein IPG89_09655 [Bacteroidetes bacterium]|nr:hypothetical protein [Bacteroidota bacterium]